MAPCRIHNVRFYNLAPREVVCLSYERTKKQLALARLVLHLKIVHNN